VKPSSVFHPVTWERVSWPPCLHNDGCAGWGTWLECQRPSIPTLCSLRSWRVLLLATASRRNLLGQLSAKTSRQLAYHTRVGSGMCRRGTNHFGADWCRACRLHKRPPHWHTYSRPGHANAKGGCYLWFGLNVWLAPSSFAWKPFSPRIEPVKGYCNCMGILMDVCPFWPNL